MTRPPRLPISSVFLFKHVLAQTKTQVSNKFSFHLGSVTQGHVQTAFEYAQGGRFYTVIALEYDPSYLQVHVTIFSVGITQ